MTLCKEIRKFSAELEKGARQVWVQRSKRMTSKVARTGVSEAIGFTFKIKSQSQSWPQPPASACGIWKGPRTSFLAVYLGEMTILKIAMGSKGREGRASSSPEAANSESRQSSTGPMVTVTCWGASHKTSESPWLLKNHEISPSLMN